MQKNQLTNSDIWIKTFSKLGTQGNFPNLIKGINEKHIANIILSDMNAFLLRSGKKQGKPFWGLQPVQYGKKNEVKDFQIGREEIKLSHYLKY